MYKKYYKSKRGRGRGRGRGRRGGKKIVKTVIYYR